MFQNLVAVCFPISPICFLLWLHSLQVLLVARKSLRLNQFSITIARGPRQSLFCSEEAHVRMCKSAPVPYQKHALTHPETHHGLLLQDHGFVPGEHPQTMADLELTLSWLGMFHHVDRFTEAGFDAWEMIL